jgi:hypothetical protein
MECYRCGDKGHLAYDCKNIKHVNGTPLETYVWECECNATFFTKQKANIHKLICQANPTKNLNETDTKKPIVFDFTETNKKEMNNTVPKPNKEKLRTIVLEYCYDRAKITDAKTLGIIVKTIFENMKDKKYMFDSCTNVIGIKLGSIKKMHEKCSKTSLDVFFEYLLVLINSFAGGYYKTQNYTSYKYNELEFHLRNYEFHLCDDSDFVFFSLKINPKKIGLDFVDNVKHCGTFRFENTEQLQKYVFDIDDLLK